LGNIAAHSLQPGKINKTVERIHYRVLQRPRCVICLADEVKLIFTKSCHFFDETACVWQQLFNAVDGSAGFRLLFTVVL
jgi:hypothetical protein